MSMENMEKPTIDISKATPEYQAIYKEEREFEAGQVMRNKEKEEAGIMSEREATEKDAEFRAMGKDLGEKWWLDLPFPIALAIEAVFGDKNKTTAMDIMREDAKLEDKRRERAELGMTLEEVFREKVKQGMTSKDIVLELKKKNKQGMTAEDIIREFKKDNSL